MKVDLYLRKDTGYYYALLTSRSGKRTYRSLKTKERRSAIKELDHWRRVAEKSADCSLTFQEAVDSYLEAYTLRASETSVTRYKDALAHISSFLGDVLLGEVTLELLTNYQIARSTSAKKNTIDYEIDVCRAFFRWCVNRKWAAENPATTRKVPRLLSKAEKENTGKRIFTDEELKYLLNPESTHYPQFLFLYFTGVRIMELGTLQVKDVGDKILIRPKSLRVNDQEIHWRPKTYEERAIPILPQLQPVLAQAIAGKEPEDLVFTSPQGKMVTDHLGRAIKKSTGATDVSAHTFRHTFISHALNRWGLPLPVVQKWVGHRNLKTTQAYIHTSVDDLERGAMKIAQATSQMPNVK